MSDLRFSQILSVDECSNVPNWSRLGFFSCHPCNVWRGKKVVNPLCATKESRGLLSHWHQCTRKKSGKCLSIQIVCRDESSTTTNNSLIPSEQQSDVPTVLVPKKPSPKLRYLKRSINLQCKKVQLKSENGDGLGAEMAKKERAQLIKTNLMVRRQACQGHEWMQMSQLIAQQKREIEVSKETVVEARKKLKESQSLSNYYKAKWNVKKGKVLAEDLDVLAHLEILLSKLFPRKHPSTKAKLLMDEVISGRLYNGDAKEILMNYVRSYVKDPFRPWRGVKAGDVSAIGAFKTSTVKALNEVADREKIGLFSITIIS